MKLLGVEVKDVYLTFEISYTEAIKVVRALDIAELDAKTAEDKEAAQALREFYDVLSEGVEANNGSRSNG